MNIRRRGGVERRKLTLLMRHLRCDEGNRTPIVLFLGSRVEEEGSTN